MSDDPAVIVEILTHLPVKSLLRFRSVSKYWCALIDSPYFINLHQNQSKKKHRIFTLFRELNRSTSSYSLCLDSIPEAAKLVIPLNSPVSFDQILGSCNGLIFLSKGSFHQQILLWNPSTRRHRLIWTMPIGYQPDSEHRFTDGVGYDHVNDDYKVVVLSHYRGSNSNSVSCKVNVYSMKSNLWQLLGKDFPYHICEHRRQRCHGMSCSGSISHGVFICGCIHWVVTQNPAPDMNYLIVSFDLARESYELVPQPKYSNKYMAIDLGILGGCLCVIGCHEKYCVTVDVWVMGTYGVKESWKKLVTMTMSDVMSVLPCVRPITFLKNGKEVVFEVDHESFVRYDLENKTRTIVRKNPNDSYAITYVYNESLVF